MKLYKLILAAFIFLISSSGANAQYTYSGYFLDGYTYRYEMNPAVGNERGFLSMPLLGNTNTSLRGTLNISDLIHKHNGETVLFTNPNIPSDIALNKIKNISKLSFDHSMTLLAFGFKGLGGYTALTASLRANTSLALPKAIFELAKDGVTNREYDLSSLYYGLQSYAQVALNHSFDIKFIPGLKIGATFKYITGITDTHIKFNDTKISLGEDTWKISANAQLKSSITGFKLQSAEPDPENPDQPKIVTGFDSDGTPNINGRGMAWDLGIEYKIKNLKFSASILDWGKMKWGKTLIASTNGTHEFSTADYTFSFGGSQNSSATDPEKMTEDLMKLFEFVDNGQLESDEKPLTSTLNLGIEYTLPFCKKITVSALGTSYYNGILNDTQYRIGANFAPGKVFSFNTNVVMGTYGLGFGWLVDLHAPGFNLFIGMDRCFNRLSRQYIPLNTNASINAGLNFLL